MEKVIKEILERSKTLGKMGALAKRPEFTVIIESTSFLPKTAKVAQRLWHIEHDVKEIPTCQSCDSPVNWSRPKKSYQKYCSSACAWKDKETRGRRIEKNLRRYGSVSPFGNKSVQQKSKQTNIERYGVDNPTKNQTISKKVHDLWTKKSKKEKEKIRESRKKTIQLKFGSSNVFSSDHGKNKIRATIQKRYGVPFYNQKHISPENLEKLMNRQWMENEYTHERKTADKISKELGVDPTTVCKYLKNHNILITHSYSQSQPERDITQLLEDHGIHPQTNDRNIIPPLELDIYIPEHNLAIEYCGLYWHSDARLDQNYHKTKMDKCSEKGIRLLTIFEDEWIQKRDIVESKILSLLQLDKSPSTFARKCSVMLVSTKTKRDFFNEYHIQGDGPSSLNLGLIYEDNLVACMGFISRKNRTFELNRYATSGKVPGGFSKLLSYFKSTQEWCTISSFADLRWSQGNLYEKCGFELHTTAKPDYSYSPDGNTRHHKFNFRRKNLQKILPGFDPRLTEFENCDNHGILRIWDCGKKRYTLTNHCS